MFVENVTWNKELIGAELTSLVANRANLSIACVVGAMLLFSLNDSVIKFLSGDYPLHELVLIRTLIGIAVTMAILAPLEGGWHVLKTQRLPLHFLRGFCIVVANFAFFSGLAVVPLAEATAVFFCFSAARNRNFSDILGRASWC